MPRGKNYVNNHKGVALAAPKGKKSERMIECQFGAGCTRPDCIYRHPSKKEGTFQQSQEPCMSFLAGVCAFSAKGCRKRHPPKAEAERLIAKYKMTRCRFGSDCRTNGCLYIHPGDKEDNVATILAMNSALFPPLASPNGQQSLQAAHPLQNSAWKASPVLPQQNSYNKRPVNYSNSVYSSSTPRVATGESVAAPAVPTAKVSPDEKLNANAKAFVPGSYN